MNRIWPYTALATWAGVFGRRSGAMRLPTSRCPEQESLRAFVNEGGGHCDGVKGVKRLLAN